MTLAENDCAVHLCTMVHKTYQFYDRTWKRIPMAKNVVLVLVVGFLLLSDFRAGFPSEVITN